MLDLRRHRLVLIAVFDGINGPKSKVLIPHLEHFAEELDPSSKQESYDHIKNVQYLKESAINSLGRIGPDAAIPLARLARRPAETAFIGKTDFRIECFQNLCKLGPHSLAGVDWLLQNSTDDFWCNNDDHYNRRHQSFIAGVVKIGKPVVDILKKHTGFLKKGSKKQFCQICITKIENL